MKTETAAPLGKLDKMRAKVEEQNKAAEKRGFKDVVYLASERPDLLKTGLIPTGNLALDRILGGGLVRGGCSQVAGLPGAGKSRCAIDILAYNQRLDPSFVGCLVNVEDSTSPEVAIREAGVDTSRLIRLDVEKCGEDLFDKLMEFLVEREKDAWTSRSLGILDLIIFDSVAALAPNAELNQVLEKGLEGATVGRHAAMLSKVFRDVMGMNALGQSHLLLINQKRTEVKYGGNVDPGGNAIGFYPKLKMEFRNPRGERLIANPGKKGLEHVYGHLVEVEVVKNNTGFGFPYAKTSFEVIYGKGVNQLPSLIEMSTDAGLFRRSGSWYYAEWPEGKGEKKEDQLKWASKDKLETWLLGSPENVRLLTTRLGLGEIRVFDKRPGGASPAVGEEDED